jgi:hypothetical protein
MIVLTAILLSSALSQTPAKTVKPTEITVYNQGFAFVKESRSLNLRKGLQTVEVKDVPSKIEATSVGIRSISDPGSLTILEQNYQYDLISSEAILNKSVGQKIRFVQMSGGHTETLDGTLLSAPTSEVSAPDGSTSNTYNGMVIKTDDGRIVLNPTGVVEVRTLPAGLISVPTLMWDLESSKEGANNVELSYLTQGVNWTADYVLTLDGDKTSDLQGWVTIDNQSGATWENARLKLLAGEVNRVQPKAHFMSPRQDISGFQAAAPAFREQSIFEYHLYTLQRPATVRNRETKQLSLLQANGVPFTKKITLDAMGDFGNYYPGESELGTGDVHPKVSVEFLNNEASHLGMPLPKGKVKVYQRDKDGSAQMLGEAAIDHTPKNERVSLPIGKSFDIVANRKRTTYKKLSSSDYLETFQIEVRNRKTTPETVHVIERHWGDWNITQKSDPFTKIDSNTVDFPLSLKPNEVHTVTYTVETKW